MTANDSPPAGALVATAARFASGARFGRVAIILVNYRGWSDTIACLESLQALAYRDFDVFVTENASPDDSFERLCEWLRRQAIFDSSVVGHEGEVLRRYPNNEACSRLYLTRTNKNLGFAGGNNISMSLARRLYDYGFYWILNNDTEVTAKSLGSLIDSARSGSAVGMVGSTLRFFHDRENVQTYGGGRYNKWIARVQEIRNVGQGEEAGRLDYCTGASMLVTREFIDKVGLMEEGYFLYCEELDWAIRGKEVGFALAHAPLSIVYHKEGASIGTDSRDVARRSEISDFYSIRSRILLTKRFFPSCLPTVYLSMLLVIFNRLRRKQYKRARLVLRIIVNSRTSYE